MRGLVAEKIREACKRKGITQSELSKEINMHRNSIINFETGRRNPRIKDLIKIAKALSVPVEQLISDR